MKKSVLESALTGLRLDVREAMYCEVGLARFTQKLTVEQQEKRLRSLRWRTLKRVHDQLNSLLPGPPHHTCPKP